MAALLERPEQALSVTDMARHVKTVLDNLHNGEQGHYVIMRNNAPAAVLMQVEMYQGIMDELEELRLESIVKDRLSYTGKMVSHADVVNRFK